jgi:hypothetical protein
MTGNLRLVSTRHSRCGDGVRESRRECSGHPSKMHCVVGPVSVQSRSSLGPVWSSFGDWSVLVGPPWPVLAIGRSWLVRHGHGWFSGWSAARGWVYFLNRTRTKSEPTTLQLYVCTVCTACRTVYRHGGHGAPNRGRPQPALGAAVAGINKHPRMRRLHPRYRARRWRHSRRWLCHHTNHQLLRRLAQS